MENHQKENDLVDSIDSAIDFLLQAKANEEIIDIRWDVKIFFNPEMSKGRVSKRRRHDTRWN
ncbi:MAG: hypothetical protein ACPHDO_02280 [Candidatus Poseidoniaceae archaeon]